MGTAFYCIDFSPCLHVSFQEIYLADTAYSSSMGVTDLDKAIPLPPDSSRLAAFSSPDTDFYEQPFSIKSHL